MSKELILKVLGDPLFDDDIVAVHLFGVSTVSRTMRGAGVRVDAYLVPVPGQLIGNQSIRKKMLAMDLLIYVRYVRIDGIVQGGRVFSYLNPGCPRRFFFLFFLFLLLGKWILVLVEDTFDLFLIITKFHP